MTNNPFSLLSSTPQGQSSNSALAANPVDSPAPGDAASSSKRSAGRRKKHRAGKKKRTRRESFAPLQDDDLEEEDEPASARDVARESLCNLQRTFSQSSVDSQALSSQKSANPSATASLPMSANGSCRDRNSPTRGGPSSLGQSGHTPAFIRQTARRRTSQATPMERDLKPFDEHTPLMSASHHDLHRGSSTSPMGRPKPPFNVNYPPSVPTTPTLGPVGHDMSFGDVLIRDKLARDESPDRLSLDERQGSTKRRSPSPVSRRKSTESAKTEDPSRFQAPELSEVAEEDVSYTTTGRTRRRHRRRRPWPDLSALEAWKDYEKKQEISRGVKRITEPQLINGRLRAVRKGWFRSDDDLPFRFTYFNEDLHSTIHSQTISGLVKAGGSFRELFIPEPRVLSDDSSDDDDEWNEGDLNPFTRARRGSESADGDSKPPLSPLHTRFGEAVAEAQGSTTNGRNSSASLRPTSQFGGEARGASPSPFPKLGQVGTESPKTGDRPVWWLDVLSPTEDELKVISQAFGIHPLSAEDIMLEEAREKVELFHNYYFVNYRTFDQDPRSANYMDPVNMYSVVFREGIITFHFSMTPHPANVRRRIRQLNDYLLVSSDWISYALVDDITDVFGPIIEDIEEEVDDIDEAIMSSWGDEKKKEARGDDEKASMVTPELTGGDVLRRVGDCRKRVMSLYRLLGNKADVIKGFAKRCNEQYMVTPHSDIGLYLGDIQDHIVTMTSNLSHYEK